jgi:hypothetical protein
LHEVYETENSLYMVLDLLEGGSFYDKIKVPLSYYIIAAWCPFQPTGNITSHQGITSRNLNNA